MLSYLKWLNLMKGFLVDKLANSLVFYFFYVEESKYIYSCNQSRDAIEFSSKIFKRFPTNTQQAHANDPSFQYGKDYIFFCK